MPRERPSLWPLSAAAYTRAGPLRFYQLAQDQERHDTGPLLTLVRCPVLVHRRHRRPGDPLVDGATVLTRAIPGARAVQVAGGTHALTDSYPIEVAMHTLDFLEDLAGR